MVHNLYEVVKDRKQGKEHIVYERRGNLWYDETVRTFTSTTKCGSLDIFCGKRSR